MKTYFNQLDIHTNHIFDFETECFFKDPLEFNKTQTRKILSQLIKKLSPIDKAYSKSLKNDPCPLIQNYLITIESSDFDYWFALKLRQYQIRLKDISRFLTYHLYNSFNNDKKLFYEFLKMTLLQYEKIFFNKKVSKMVKKYFNSALFSIEHTFCKTVPRKPKTDYNTLLLKSYQNEVFFFKKNIVVVMDVWSALKKDNFISKETSFESFKNIFKDQLVDPKNRVIWTGTNKELQWFVKYLVYESNKVVNLYNDIWLVTIKCFIKSDGKEFTESQLRNASGTLLKRKKTIESVLSNL
ncbi:hypothetical protein [uncultured Aquimarina sp.]|uniref:hypothetical protein n=1 Tax=uncultured Aquimarina sp. TaxID=575652 RepID=UPI0026286890|nr:hypothetical protein [uncultured Aquimarina sp.]